MLQALLVILSLYLLLGLAFVVRFFRTVDQPMLDALLREEAGKLPYAMSLTIARLIFVLVGLLTWPHLLHKQPRE